MKQDMGLKNLLISIGSGYHPGVRMLHAMIKDKSNCKILFIAPIRKTISIDDNLRENYSSGYEDFANTFGVIRKFLAQGRFKLVGISFMSHYWDVFVCICNIIRQELKDCKIIAGGVHAWHIAPQETLQHSDYVCAAEGEELYSRLVDALSRENPDSHPFLIPGLIERDGDKVIHTKNTDRYISLDELPLPTYGGDMIYSIESFDDYPVMLNKDPMCDSISAYIHIGRGCPFKCTYCINSLVEKPRVRIRKVDRVIEEIKMLQKIAKITQVFFMDEIFPLKEEWLNEFVEKYKKEIALPFQVTLFPGMLNEKRLNLLESAGLREMTVGLQSGSEVTRKYVYARSDKNERIISENLMLSRHKIMTYYDIIIRNPFESEKDLKETLFLVSRLKRPFYLKFYTMAFFPKHPITIRALDEKLISEEDTQATISYKGVTTPHKVVLAKHYYLESELLIWNDRMIKKARSGSIEHLYYLMMSYFGYWFIPESVLNIVYNQFIKKRYSIVICFAFIIKAVLIMRNNFIVRNLMLLIDRIREKGVLWTVNLVLNKLKNCLLRMT